MALATAPPDGMRHNLRMRVISFCLIATAMVAAEQPQTKHENAVLDLWMAGKPAFGVFVPNEAAGGGRGRGEPGAPRPKPVYTKAGGEKLAANPLYDYVFLNLEGNYDGEAVKAIVEGLRNPQAVSRKTLIVRVPPFHLDAAAGAARIKEVFALGADGITFPHVQSVDEAERIMQAFQAAKINVWSPSNPRGEKIAMLMIEDPGALAQVKELAAVKGISVLACGIGSITAAFGGDRAKGEEATQTVLAETTRAKIPNMLTANSQDVEKRIKEGFLGLLMQGAQADEAIKIGRAAAGR
jgi:2-keto-3-deoxy-L-rhamnonate aldolase RhmA